MKVYTLIITYNEEKEEIEHITEQLEGGSKSVLEEHGVVNIGDYYDEDDLKIIANSYNVGEA